MTPWVCVIFVPGHCLRSLYYSSLYSCPASLSFWIARLQHWLPTVSMRHTFGKRKPLSVCTSPLSRGTCKVGAALGINRQHHVLVRFSSHHSSGVRQLALCFAVQYVSSLLWQQSYHHRKHKQSPQPLCHCLRQIRAVFLLLSTTSLRLPSNHPPSVDTLCLPPPSLEMSPPILHACHHCHFREGVHIIPKLSASHLRSIAQNARQKAWSHLIN